ncbi:unnamed protein product [Brachionus calyciflorus]|uniref:Uncharacterized protein n=1 Tax=Brachionus calyciflorus TaxID=104777 RepID=A0A813N2U1_9BILA|nr:unnamed protein product [Brachionus calyciflorus]
MILKINLFWFCIIIYCFSAFKFFVSAQELNSTEKCIVYRTKYRKCYPENAVCIGDSVKTEQLIYVSCPVLTQTQIDAIISGRETAQVIELANINNQTTAAIKAIQIKFATEIKSSTSFAYIAISMNLLIN